METNKLTIQEWEIILRGLNYNFLNEGIYIKNRDIFLLKYIFRPYEYQNVKI